MLSGDSEGEAPPRERFRAGRLGEGFGGGEGLEFRLLPAAHDPASLTVELAAVPPAGVAVAVSADAETLGFTEAEFEVAGRVRLEGRLERMTGEGFRLRARLGGRVRLDCGRCLEAADAPFDEALDLVYLPGVPPAEAEPRGGGAAADGGEAASGGRARGDLSGGEHGLDPDDMNVSFYRADRLPLRETLWEQIHLALPAKPLCAPDCRGLCPSCGANRNTVSRCGCAASPAPGGGLAALRDLPGLRGRPSPR